MGSQEAETFYCIHCNGDEKLKVLNCAHVYCSHCLEQLQSQDSHTVCCGICQRLTGITVKGIEGLPSQRFFNQIRETQLCTKWLKDRYRAFYW